MLCLLSRNIQSNYVFVLLEIHGSILLSFISFLGIRILLNLTNYRVLHSDPKEKKYFMQLLVIKIVLREGPVHNRY